MIQPGPRVYAALFLVAFATVMFEILLTRILSITMWYHFAFMAISVAMLGMTVGALAVFLGPEAWRAQSPRPAMAWSALLFALTAVPAVLFHVGIELPDLNVSTAPVLWAFAIATVPFVFSGVFVCLALTRFARSTGRLYAADLSGAALGCLGVVLALGPLDGVGAAFACAAASALGGALLLEGRARFAGALVACALGGAALWAGWQLAVEGRAAFPIRYAKGNVQQAPEIERWNAFSRIAVYDEGADAPIVAWSLSGAYRGPLSVRSRWLMIDSVAGTPLIAFDGDLRKVDYLRWDLTNFPHHLRSGASVAIVGSGGGRDILAARLFGQRNVVGIEINPDIVDLLTHRYAGYTGHLERLPGVTIVTDEARSYLARTRQRFDILQLTFVDTFAASAAGAFALTENSLYTREAWKLFVERLTRDGLIAVTRAVPAETQRLVSLARAALLDNGVRTPERHIVLLANQRAERPPSWGNMGLLLVSRRPYPEDELRRIEHLAADMQFEVELMPGRKPATPLLETLATGRGLDELRDSQTLNYEAPTDNSPFFFNMLQLRHWTTLRRAAGYSSINYKAVEILMDLLLGVASATLACIVAPLLLARHRISSAAWPLLGYFAAIGTGFMLIEISMMQRLIIFIGQPVYALSVILFALLLAAGVGSALSGRVPDRRLGAGAAAALLMVLAGLTCAGLLLPWLLGAYAAAETPVRLAASAGLLALMGLGMGTAFPLGMRIALASQPGIAPWLWGINGATSVLASVLAVVVAMAIGISVSYWGGVACYGVALLMLRLTDRR